MTNPPPTAPAPDPTRAAADAADLPAGAPQPPGPAAGRRRWLWALVALAFALRVVIAATTWGSDDTWGWEKHGESILVHGFRDAYAHEYVPYNPLNHPPIPVLCAAALVKLQEATRVPFWLTGRVVIIGFDALAAWLLFRIWQRRAGLGLAAVGAWAWSVMAILSSAYHGNTDPAMATLALLAAHLMAGGRAGWAGLALAAAANVKIVPIPMIPLLAAACADRAAVARYAAGVAVGMLPYAGAVAVADWPFIYGVFGYKGNLGEWGFVELAFEAGRYHPRWEPTSLWWQPAAQWVVETFKLTARWVTLGSLVALTVWAWLRRGRWDAYQLLALGFALVLVFAPSFAVQYAVWPLPLVLSLDLRRGVAYGLAGGLCIGVTYLAFVTHAFPVQSQFKGGLPPPAPMLGFVAWTVLLGFVFDALVWPRWARTRYARG